jgi:hypothetical protein
MKPFLTLFAVLLIAGIGSLGGCLIGASWGHPGGDYVGGMVKGTLLGGAFDCIASWALFSQPRPSS